MSIKRLYKLFEAGVPLGKAPATQGKKKPKRAPRISGNTTFPPHGDPDSDFEGPFDGSVSRIPTFNSADDHDYEISQIRAGELGDETGFAPDDREDNNRPYDGPVRDDDEDDGDLGPDADYEDPVEPESDGDEVAPEPEKKPTGSFASKSAPPSAALRGGKPGLEVKADKETIKALLKALNAVRTRDDDLNSWIDDCIREIERSKDGSVTLPKFESSDFGDEDEE
jgi:hypothetical protein